MSLHQTISTLFAPSLSFDPLRYLWFLPVCAAVALGGLAVLLYQLQRIKHRLSHTHQLLDALVAHHQFALHLESRHGSAAPVSPAFLQACDMGSETTFLSPAASLGLMACIAAMPCHEDVRTRLRTIYDACQKGRWCEAYASTAIIFHPAHRQKRQYLTCHVIPVGDNYLWCLSQHTETTRAQCHQTHELRIYQAIVRKLQHIVNTLPFPIWLRSCDGHIVYANLAYSSLVDQEIAEASLERSVYELYPSAEQLTRSVQSTNRPQSDAHYLVAEGKRCLYRMTEMPVLGDLEHSLVGFALDCSHEDMMQHELARYISAQTDLLESSASAMAVYGADRCLRFFNEAFVTLWHLDAAWLATSPSYGEILDMLHHKRLLPETADFRRFKHEQQAMFTALTTPYNDFYYLPDGRSLRVIVIPYALGGLLFAYEDMTDYLTLQSSYNTLIAVQKATLDHLHEAVLVCGLDGRISLTNSTFATLWHADATWLAQQPHISDILTHLTKQIHFTSDPDSYRATILARIEQHSVCKERIERLDGSVVERIYVPLPDGATLISDRNITDSLLLERSLRERNEILEEAERMKAKFIANVSCELRSPLTTIMSVSEMLARCYGGPLNPKQLQYIQHIHTASQHLMLLINDMIDLALLEAGHITLELKDITIQPMLYNMMRLFQHPFEHAQATITLTCDETIGALEGDEKRLRQVLFNLFSYMLEDHQPCHILLHAASEGEDTSKIRIQLTKHPISAKDAPPQTSAHSADTPHNPADGGIALTGSASASQPQDGYKLALTHHIIRLHGGSVQLTFSERKILQVSLLLPRHIHHTKLGALEPEEQQVAT